MNTLFHFKYSDQQFTTHQHTTDVDFSAVQLHN